MSKPDRISARSRATIHPTSASGSRSHVGGRRDLRGQSPILITSVELRMPPARTADVIVVADRLTPTMLGWIKRILKRSEPSLNKLIVITRATDLPTARMPRTLLTLASSSPGNPTIQMTSKPSTAGWHCDRATLRFWRPFQSSRRIGSLSSAPWLIRKSARRLLGPCQTKTPASSERAPGDLDSRRR